MDVEGFVVDAELGVNGEDVAGLEGAAVVGTVVVYGKTNGMGEDTATGFDHGAGRLFARDCAFKISHETNEARNVKNNKDN